jgi:hypothetical protein
MNYRPLRVLLVQHEDVCEIVALDDVEALQVREGGSHHRKHELKPGVGAYVQMLQTFKGIGIVVIFAPNVVGHQEIRCPYSLQCRCLTTREDCFAVANLGF